MSAKEKLKSVEDVIIDDGEFKYILIKVFDPADGKDTTKFIVRGLASAAFHDNIYEEVAPKIENLGLKCECVGGGKIKHSPTDKTIEIWGSSKGFGKADHDETCQMLQKEFPNYKKISCSDEE